jgi:hypothetical protein
MLGREETANATFIDLGLIRPGLNDNDLPHPSTDADLRSYLDNEF